MRAHVEILSGIVRVGPDADAIGKPFDYAVAFSASEGMAEVKALVADGFTMARARAIGRALNALGLTYTWKRFDDRQSP